MTKDDDHDVHTCTCWTVVWCMLDQGWSGTVNCKHSHHSFNWSQLIVLSIAFNWPNIQLIFQVFSKNNIWLHLKIPMANPNGMDYRFWQNPNLTKRSFSIYISFPLSSNARPTFRGLLVAGIQVRVNRKTNPKLCGQEIQSCNEGQIRRWQFSTKPGFRGRRSCARQLFISPHNIFRKTNTKQETALSSSFLWLFMQSETIFEVPDMRRHSRQKIVFARNFLGIFCRVVLTREEKKRGLRRQTKAGKVST